MSKETVISTVQQMTRDEFNALGEKLYGENPMKWKFKCVRCGGVQCGDDFRALGADPNGLVYFSCIGRYDKNRGCDWTLGGLFQIHKREIVVGENKCPVFLFADE